MTGSLSCDKSWCSPLDVCLVLIFYLELWWLGTSHHIDSLLQKSTQAEGGYLHARTTGSFLCTSHNIDSLLQKSTQAEGGNLHGQIRESSCVHH